jgi:hypothetical protein
MKRSASAPNRKMLNHGQDVGLTDASDLEKRAEEIARIESHATSAADRALAARELSGDDLPPTTDDDAISRSAITRDPSEPPSIGGRQIPDQKDEDEDGQSTVERLVADGVNEADREQMLADRNRRRRPEEI